MTVFLTSRVLPWGPSEVYAAFADPGRLAAWWGPEGFSSTFHTFDFREGGCWSFTMHGPDGKAYPNACTFLALQANAHILISHDSQPRFQLAITLTACDGGTRVRWEQTFVDDALAEVLRPMVEPANEQNLDRWARALASTGPST